MNRWRVSDVMTTQVISVRPDTGYQRVADLLPKLNYPDRVPAHPLVSRRRRAADRRALGDTAGELMTSPAETVTSSATLA